MSTQPEPLDIEDFERAIYQRAPGQEGIESAFKAIRAVLTAVKNDSGFKFYGKAPTAEHTYTRIAAAIASFLSDPSFGLSYDGFCQLMVDHATLHSIFKGSVFGSADNTLRLVGTRAGEGNYTYNTNGQLQKWLMLWSLESGMESKPRNIAQAMPEFVSAALLGTIGIGGVHNEVAYRRKIELSKMHDLIEHPMHENMMLAACDTYMHCSYNDDPDRHEIKKVLNRMFREVVTRKMADNGRFIVERTDPPTAKDRPKIVIPVEWFSSTHAMYRCYAASVRQLRHNFECVAVARPGDIDDKAKETFDRVVTLEAGASMLKMLEALQDEKPDIIFYPSLGMAAWWVALSQFRLAPLQIMCPGHPATTHNPMIDYMLTDEDLIGDRSKYSEKVIGLPVGTTRYSPPDGFSRSQIKKRKPNYACHIAVSAMVMKLNPPFLAALKKISDLCRTTEWHFFPNMQATNHYLIEREIKAWIPSAVVHHRKTYGEYMNTLAQCDVMLESFPFGGTNSCIDALLCSMPVVCYEGDQIQERSDASMIRRVGLPEWLITHSTDEYIDAAVRLISNWHTWAALKDSLRGKDVEAEFYGDGPPEVWGKFGEAVFNIWQREVARNGKKGGVHSAVGGDGVGVLGGISQRNEPA